MRAGEAAGGTAPPHTSGAGRPILAICQTLNQALTPGCWPRDFKSSTRSFTSRGIGTDVSGGFTDEHRGVIIGFIWYSFKYQFLYSR